MLPRQQQDWGKERTRCRGEERLRWSGRAAGRSLARAVIPLNLVNAPHPPARPLGLGTGTTIQCLSARPSLSTWLFLKCEPALVTPAQPVSRVHRSSQTRCVTSGSPSHSPRPSFVPRCLAPRPSTLQAPPTRCGRVCHNTSESARAVKEHELGPLSHPLPRACIHPNRQFGIGPSSTVGGASRAVALSAHQQSPSSAPPGLKCCTASACHSLSHSPRPL